MKEDKPSSENPQNMGGPTLKAGLNSPSPADASREIQNEDKTKTKQKGNAVKQ